MTDTVKGLPKVKVNHIRATSIEDAFVNGMESKKKLLQGGLIPKKTKLTDGDTICN